MLPTRSASEGSLKRVGNECPPYGMMMGAGWATDLLERGLSVFRLPFAVCYQRPVSFYIPNLCYR